VREEVRRCGGALRFSAPFSPRLLVLQRCAGHFVPNLPLTAPTPLSQIAVVRLLLSCPPIRPSLPSSLFPPLSILLACSFRSNTPTPFPHQASIFNLDSFRLESNHQNEIYLEVSTDALARALKSCSVRPSVTSPSSVSHDPLAIGRIR